MNLLVLLSFLWVITLGFNGCSLGEVSGSRDRENDNGNEHPLSFLSVSGSAFRNSDTDEFRFIGINLDPWRFAVHRGEIYSQEDFDEWLINAKDLTGASVVRMHIMGSLFEPEIGKYREDAFVQLDKLIASAADNRMYVIVGLRDYLHAPWPPEEFDPYWFLDGGTESEPNKDAIYGETGMGYYKEFVSHLLNRVNTVNGMVYKDDPTVMAWEIINEPSFPYSEEEITKNFLSEMGQYIRGISSKHMLTVSLGSAEEIWWDAGEWNWSQIDIPEIDFVTVNYYADESLYYPQVDSDNVFRIRQRVESSLALGKPVIFGEFGCQSNIENYRETVKIIYSTILENVFEEGAAGAVPFSWGPPGPNGWGDTGSFAVYTDKPGICSVIKEHKP